MKFLWVLTISLLCCCPEVARGFTIQLTGGYSGTAELSSADDPSAAIAVIPVSFGGYLDLWAGDSFALSIGFSQYQSIVTRTLSGINATGTLHAVGVGLGLISGQPDSYHHLYAEAWANPVLKLKTEALSIVNGENFKHSSIDTYSGGTGALLRWSRVFAIGKNKREPSTLFGFFLEGVAITFSTRAISSLSSDLVISPAQETQETGAFSFMYGAAGFFLGYAL